MDILKKIEAHRPPWHVRMGTQVIRTNTSEWLFDAGFAAQELVSVANRIGELEEALENLTLADPADMAAVTHGGYTEYDLALSRSKEILRKHNA